MMEFRCILDENKRVIPCPKNIDWGTFMKDVKGRRVSETHLPDDFWVSTVFLGIDHGGFPGEPNFFETMVFQRNRALDEYTERCGTFEEAKKMHTRVLRKFKRDIKNAK